MPPKTKSTKDMITQAAYGITKERGIYAVTAQAVAKKLGCSTQPVYWVFNTMDNLRSEIVKTANAEYNRYLLTEIKGLQKYKAIGWNYIRFAKEQPELFKLLFMADRQSQTDISNSNLDDNKSYILSLITEQTGLDETKANELYVDMWLFSHGIAAMLVTKTVKLSDETISQMLTDMYLGLLNRFKGEN